jgi:hypothetical protein
VDGRPDTSTRIGVDFAKVVAAEAVYSDSDSVGAALSATA